MEILAPAGATVPVKSAAAIIETGLERPAASTLRATEQTSPGLGQPTKPSLESSATEEPSTPTGRRKVLLRPPHKDDISEDGVGLSEIRPAVLRPQTPAVTPVVMKLAERHHLGKAELAGIQGTGAQGRITKLDLLSYLELRSRPGHSLPPSAGTAAKPSEVAEDIPYNAAGIYIEQLGNMRRKIAEHMVRSKATSPHVYTVAEADVSSIVQWREAQNSEFTAREGFKLSYTPCFLEAVAKTLRRFPRLNASVDGDNLILKQHINLGCAVALGTGGLVVPVLRDADQSDFSSLARTLNDFAQRARTRKLLPDETLNGTFTVTNPGIFGSIIGYPIINQPQLGIIGVGVIKKRPVVIDGMIAVRDIVYLTLSYDHRVIDGALAGTFLNTIVRYLENWDSTRRA